MFSRLKIEKKTYAYLVCKACLTIHLIGVEPISWCLLLLVTGILNDLFAAI